VLLSIDESIEHGGSAEVGQIWTPITPLCGSVLHADSQFISETTNYIHSQGGFVHDFGFSIPPPCSPSEWICKTTGEIISSNGVSPLLAKQLFTELYEIAKSNMPF
jgi:hypothetical protein